jgi:hypothetical protein
VRALSTVASFSRHRATAVVEALILLAIVVTLTLGFALVNGTHSPAGADNVFAAKGGRTGGGHGGSSATITVPDGVFGGTTTATVSNPGLWVYNACSKGGAVVGQQWAITDTAGKAVLYLGPTALWTSGGASCVAQVGSWSNKGTWVSQGSTTFSVAA